MTWPPPPTRTCRHTPPSPLAPPRRELVAERPRAYLLHNFLSAEECEHVISIAAPMMERSGVVSSDGGSEKHDIRTSYGTFIRKARSGVCAC